MEEEEEEGMEVLRAAAAAATAVGVRRTGWKGRRGAAAARVVMEQEVDLMAAGRWTRVRSVRRAREETRGAILVYVSSTMCCALGPGGYLGIGMGNISWPGQRDCIT